MDAIDMKDRLLLAVLPNVPFDGWSVAALRAGAREIGITEAEALALFPRTGPELVASFSRWADRAMLAAASGTDFEALKVRQRIAAAIRARLKALEPYREASRRALALLALPQNVPLGLRLLYDTVDAVWYAAGDTATDFNFYTKRALLAGVYGATVIYWLDDKSPNHEATWAFLDRRIGDIMQIQKLRGRFAKLSETWPNPARFFRRRA
jgi:ubiquinone biosynthesis protein COQ9